MTFKVRQQTRTAYCNSIYNSLNNKAFRESIRNVLFFDNYKKLFSFGKLKFGEWT